MSTTGSKAVSWLREQGRLLVRLTRHHRAGMSAGDSRGSNEPVEFRFRSMTQADAEAIAAWRYPDEYSFYDWTSDPDDLAELLDERVRADQYAAVDSEGEP